MKKWASGWNSLNLPGRVFRTKKALLKRLAQQRAPWMAQHPDFNDFSLAPDDRDPGTYWLWGFGEYGRNSVLEGQPRQARLDAGPKDEMLAKYPGVAVEEHGPGRMDVQMPSSAPDWFDPMDAGEAWGEDDY